MWFARGSGMAARLERKRVAVLATDGFEQAELDSPIRAFIAERCRVDIVAPDGKDTIRGWLTDHWGDAFPVDCVLSQADSAAYDGLVLPGGPKSPDRLRSNTDAVAFIRSFVESGRLVAAISTAPSLLIEAGAAHGRRLTSAPSSRSDLEKARAKWVDEPVVQDGNLVTCRGPEMMEAFLRATISAMQDRPGQGQARSSHP
jgi:protease I